MSTDANARGDRPTLGHIRGLDGIRALSVLAIIAFHTGLNSVPGGFYGVDSFFVLSGFLITSLLVKEWGGTGTIRLRRFWAGRARRLLPALFLLVAVIGIVLAVVPGILATPHVLGDALSTVFYVSNWYSIHGGVTYFSLTTQPSPLLHTWSLAIEEQFYLVWPLVVLGVLKLGTGRRARRSPGRRVEVLGGGTLVLVPPPRAEHDPAWACRRRLHVLFAVAGLGSLASAIVMVCLAPSGYTTRAYYGTDTRAQALLVGAAIAIGLTLWREGSRRPWFTRLASVLAIAGVLGTAALWATTSETSTFAFSGGFLVASFAAGAVVLGCAVAPRSLVVRLLELPPLPQWGRISYGVYLWYWPVLLVMTGQRLHWGVYPLFLARVGITVAIAAISYDFVEMPIRRGALGHWRSWVAAPVGAAVAIGAVFVSTLLPVGATELQGTQLSASAPPPTTTSTTSTTPSHATVPDPTTTTTTVPSYLTPDPPPRTSTKPVKVLLIGDSIAGTLGVGLAQEARPYGVQIVNEGTPGCSVSMRTQIRVLFYTLAPGAPCDVGGNPASLFDTWRRWVDAYNPDVVVYLARGETFDQERRRAVAERRRGPVRPLPREPLPSGGRHPRVPGRQRRADDDALLRQRDLARRHAVARGRPVAGGGRQRDHAGRGRHHADRGRRQPGLRVRPQHRRLPGQQVRRHRRAGQRALYRRRALLPLGRDLRGPAPGPRAGGAGPGPCRSLPGWRLAGPLPPSTPSWFPSLPCQ